MRIITHIIKHVKDIRKKNLGYTLVIVHTRYTLSLKFCFEHTISKRNVYGVCVCVCTCYLWIENDYIFSLAPRKYLWLYN